MDSYASRKHRDSQRKATVQAASARVLGRSGH